MIKWYCQSDGGQWNIKVYSMNPFMLSSNFADLRVIWGAGLVGTATDKEGREVLVVHKDTLHDIAQ